jgi:hypothetical protein
MILFRCKKGKNKPCPAHQRVRMGFMARVDKLMHRKQTHPTPPSHNKYTCET